MIKGEIKKDIKTTWVKQTNSRPGLQDQDNLI